MSEWIYFYEEPTRHQGLIELGRTRRTVEERNRDKRSVDPWEEIDRYPVADSESAENEIIRATRSYRYRNRKEILKIDWPTLKRIITPIVSRYSCIEHRITGYLNEFEKQYDRQVFDKYWNLLLEKKHTQESRIEQEFRSRCQEMGIDPDSRGVAGWLEDGMQSAYKKASENDLVGFMLCNPLVLIPSMLVGKGLAMMGEKKQNSNQRKLKEHIDWRQQERAQITREISQRQEQARQFKQDLLQQVAQSLRQEYERLDRNIEAVDWKNHNRFYTDSQGRLSDRVSALYIDLLLGLKDRFNSQKDLSELKQRVQSLGETLNDEYEQRLSESFIDQSR